MHQMDYVLGKPEPIFICPDQHEETLKIQIQYSMKTLNCSTQRNLMIMLGVTR